MREAPPWIASSGKTSDNKGQKREPIPASNPNIYTTINTNDTYPLTDGSVTNWNINPNTIDDIVIVINPTNTNGFLPTLSTKNNAMKVDMKFHTPIPNYFPPLCYFLLLYFIL